MHDKRYPNEGEAYREARNKLLGLEMELRQKTKEVADARGALPLGGQIPENYEFEEGSSDLSDEHNITTTKFSELFELGKKSLLIYSFMYPPEGEACPMCTSFLDSLNGNAAYLKDRISLAVVAKAPIIDIREWAKSRNWHNLRLLSSGGNTYNRDYFAEDDSGDQHGIINVFHQSEPSEPNESSEKGIFHFWGSELFFAPTDGDMHPRHVDQFWPIWNIFDLIPEGRGTDWYPSPTME